MLQFAHIALGTGGGLTCTRCAPARDAGYLPAAEIIARIRVVAEGWTDGPGPNIVSADRSPSHTPSSLRSSLRASRQASSASGSRPMLAALSVPANAAGVIRAGVRHLCVRLLDADAVRGDELSGLAGRTRDALAGVDTYRAAAEELGARVLVTALVPVCQHNLETLPATVLALASHGFDATRLVPGGSCRPRPPPSWLRHATPAWSTSLWVEADSALPLPPTHALHAVAEAVRRG